MLPKPAGDDQIEVGHIGIDVERQPVCRNAAGYVDTDGTELLTAHEDPPLLRNPIGNQPEVASDSDHALLENLNESSRTHSSAVEIDDGIEHDLTWPVIGHVTAPAHPSDLDTELSETRWIGDDVRRIAAVPQRDDWLVFEDDNGIWNLIAKPSELEVILEPEGLVIGHATRMNDPQR
jgi:hypothetical protein